MNLIYSVRKIKLILNHSFGKKFSTSVTKRGAKKPTHAKKKENKKRSKSKGESQKIRKKKMNI